MKGERMKVKKAVIPAAGKGTRMLPFTRVVPKELYPIIDTPSIHFVVKELVEAGIEQVIFVTARGKHFIEDYFDYVKELDEHLEKNGKKELLKLSREIAEMVEVISVRQKEPLGLGHAVLMAKNLVGDEPFLVVLPDEIYDIVNPSKKMVEFYERQQSPAILSMKVDDDAVSRYGIFDIEKWNGDDSFLVKEMVEKPNTENAPSNYAILGRYLLTPDIFSILENTTPGKGGEIQLTDALTELSKIQRLKGIVYSDGVRFDIGNLEGAVETIVYYGLKREGTRNKIIETVNKWLPGNVG